MKRVKISILVAAWALRFSVLDCSRKTQDSHNQLR